MCPIGVSRMAALPNWARALGEDGPDKVLPLYSEDAVLWGTLSSTVRADRAALRDYVVTAFKVLPSLKVTFGDQLIRIYDATAVNTRYYTFSYVSDGEPGPCPSGGRIGSLSIIILRQCHRCLNSAPSIGRMGEE
jgi:hypothetical protein